MSHSFLKKPFAAPSDATYITQTPNANLTAEQAMSSLATGYVKNTTTTGVQSVQAIPIPIADGGTNNTTATTNGVRFFDGTKLTDTAAGTTGQVLHGNTGAAPTFSAVSLTADVSGVLSIANGGTNNSTAYTAGSVIFSDGTKLTQDNANLFWNDTDNELYIGGTSAATANILLGADGHAIINEQGNAVNTIVQGATATKLLVVDGTNNRVDIGTTVQGRIAKFGATEIAFNDDAQNLDFRVEGQTQANLFQVDASADQVGIRTATPHSTLDIRGGISLTTATQTSGATTTLTGDDFNIVAPPGAAATNTVNLPTAASGAGRIYFIKKTTATGTLNIVPNAGAGDTIDGVSGTLALTALNSARTLLSDGGTNWLVMATV